MAKIIEKSEKRCDMLYRNLNKTTVVQGDETEISFFNEEEIAEADILVAVTGDDRTNIVASVMGRRMGVNIIISEVTRTTPVFFGCGFILTK
jgi:trk system potassium uptake protein TrkA